MIYIFKNAHLWMDVIFQHFLIHIQVIQIYQRLHLLLINTNSFCVCNCVLIFFVGDFNNKSVFYLKNKREEFLYIETQHTKD